MISKTLALISCREHYAWPRCLTGPISDLVEAIEALVFSLELSISSYSSPSSVLCHLRSAVLTQ